MKSYSQISNDKYQKEAIELLNQIKLFHSKISYFNHNNTRQIDKGYYVIHTEKLVQLLEYITYTEKEESKN